MRSRVSVCLTVCVSVQLCTTHNMPAALLNVLQYRSNYSVGLVSSSMILQWTFFPKCMRLLLLPLPLLLIFFIENCKCKYNQKLNSYKPIHVHVHSNLHKHTHTHVTHIHTCRVYVTIQTIIRSLTARKCYLIDLKSIGNANPNANAMAQTAHTNIDHHHYGSNMWHAFPFFCRIYKFILFNCDYLGFWLLLLWLNDYSQIKVYELMMKPVNKYVHNCSMQCPSNKKQLNKPAICQTKKKIKEQVEKGSNETTIYRDRYGLWSLKIKRFSSFSNDKLFQLYAFRIRLGSFSCSLCTNRLIQFYSGKFEVLLGLDDKMLDKLSSIIQKQ